MKAINYMFMLGIIILLTSASALANAIPSKPDVMNPLNFVYHTTYSVMSSTSVGDSCSSEFSITGAYCSGRIREYMQCRMTSSGLVWQQKSEDCAYNDGQCIVNKCASGALQQRYNIFLIIGTVIIALIISALIYFITKKLSVAIASGILALIIGAIIMISGMI